MFKPNLVYPILKAIADIELASAKERRDKS